MIKTPTYTKPSGWPIIKSSSRRQKRNKSGQIIIFHPPRFPWNKGIALTKPPFGVRSREVAIISPDKYVLRILSNKQVPTSWPIHGIHWVWPLPRMPVTHQEYSIFSRESLKNLYLPLLLERGHTQGIQKMSTTHVTHPRHHQMLIGHGLQQKMYYFSVTFPWSNP